MKTILLIMGISFVIGGLFYSNPMPPEYVSEISINPPQLEFVTKTIDNLIPLEKGKTYNIEIYDSDKMVKKVGEHYFTVPKDYTGDFFVVDAKICPGLQLKPGYAIWVEENSGTIERITIPNIPRGKSYARFIVRSLSKWYIVNSPTFGKKNVIQGQSLPTQYTSEICLNPVQIEYVITPKNDRPLPLEKGKIYIIYICNTNKIETEYSFTVPKDYTGDFFIVDEKICPGLKLEPGYTYTFGDAKLLEGPIIIPKGIQPGKSYSVVCELSAFWDWNIVNSTIGKDNVSPGTPISSSSWGKIKATFK